jgi:phenylacetate-coenzyme A ligase PaaK-like adenylate-forming protein
LQLHDKLATPTIQNALKQPFYNNLWTGLDLDKVWNSEEIKKLPSFGKSELSDYYECLNYHQNPIHLVHTGGTSGNLSFRVRSGEELVFLEEFFQNIAKPNLKDGRVDPLCLYVVTTSHGELVGSNRSLQLYVTGFNWFSVKSVCDLLLRRFRLPNRSEKIETLFIEPTMLLYVLSELARRSIDPASLGLKKIVLSGGHVSSHVLVQIESSFQAEIADRYGFYEGVGGATLCNECRKYYFDPFVIPDIDHSTMGGEFDRVRGELITVELFPYSQLQPLIRYRSGDLFEVSNEVCPKCNAKGHRFLGRFGSAVRDFDTNKILVYPAEFYDSLEPFPELTRVPRSSIKANSWNEDCGEILGELLVDHASRKLTVRVVPRFTPHSFPEAAQLLRNKIVSSILSSNIALSRALRTDAAKLDVELSTRDSVMGRLSMR